MRKQILFAVIGAVALGVAAFTTSTVKAKEIVIRIGSGHPPTVVYAGLMKNFFQPESIFQCACAQTGENIRK